MTGRPASVRTVALLLAFPAPAFLAATAFAQSGERTAELVSTEAIWDLGAHSSVPDLARFRDAWYCAFREGSAAESTDGIIRILRSLDGERWSKLARLEHPVADLRNPRLSVTSDNRLMLTANGAIRTASDSPFKTYVWFSAGGRDWEGPAQAGQNGDWLSEVAWNLNQAYGLAFDASSAPDRRAVRSYVSRDGKAFAVTNPEVDAGAGASHNAIAFQADSTALAVLEREGEAATRLGTSRPPYRHWEWQDLETNLAGPRMLALGDGRVIVTGAVLDETPRLAVFFLNPQEPELRELLTLPSITSRGHAGMVYYDGLLWIAYEAEDELGRNGIYLAQVRLP